MHERVTAAARHRRTLWLVLGLTASYMVVEAVAGLLAGSLVLIADAGHMFTDVAGLSLALAAIWLARRPATVRKTYGYYRAEILAALVNALLLFAVSGYILIEAWRRLMSPPHVEGVPLLAVASVGLVVNLVSARLLLRGARESLNVRGAFLEVASDVAGSAGAIVAGVILIATGWRYADPLFAAGVGVLILPRTWHLLRGALDVLLEGTPADIEIPDVQQAMLGVPGVTSVHDLHIWTVTQGFVALSGHVEVSDAADRDAVLRSLRDGLEKQFEIEHVTIQIENERLEGELRQPCLPGQAPCYPEPVGGQPPQRSAGA